MGNKIHIHTGQFPELAYLKQGEGPVIVLIHGFPENGGLWHKVWPGLEDFFTVIIPDLPGSGDSTYKGETISIEQLAESVNNILEHENVDEAIIVGHSMGGYTALAFAELFVKKLKGLSLVHSVATADTEEKKKTRLKSIELIRKGGREAFIKQMTPNLFSQKFRDENPGIIETQSERGMQLPGESIVKFYTAMINRPDRTKLLKDASFPVQWIIGKEDTIAPMSSMLEQSRLAKVNFLSAYDNCAHMAMLEAPDKLIADLKEFGRYCFYK
jgi:pimeloyl-ACP methyl ester carboxylesterase